MALTKSLQFEWAYLQRVVPNCGDAFARAPLWDTIKQKFWPAVFGECISQQAWDLVLPAYMQDRTESARPNTVFTLHIIRRTSEDSTIHQVRGWVLCDGTQGGDSGDSSQTEGPSEGARLEDIWLAWHGRNICLYFLLQSFYFSTVTVFIVIV